VTGKTNIVCPVEFIFRVKGKEYTRNRQKKLVSDCGKHCIIRVK
jgi:hypothetical protein